jgi:hypothetical protein
MTCIPTTHATPSNANASTTTIDNQCTASGIRQKTPGNYENNHR